MSHEHEKCETKWAIIFLKEEDGALEQMNRMYASMERDILHGTDEENADVLGALTMLARIAEVSDREAPERVNELGMMAAKREAKRHNRHLLGLLEDAGSPELTDAIKGLLKALKLDDLTGDGQELDPQAVTAEVEKMLAELRGPDVD